MKETENAEVRGSPKPGVTSTKGSSQAVIFILLRKKLQPATSWLPYLSAIYIDSTSESFSSICKVWTSLVP